MLDGPLVPAAYLWIGLALAFPGRLTPRTFLFRGPLAATACLFATAVAAGSALPGRALRSEIYAKNAKTAQLASAWETAVYYHDKCLAIRPYALTRINS